MKEEEEEGSPHRLPPLLPFAAKEEGGGGRVCVTYLQPQTDRVIKNRLRQEALLFLQEVQPHPVCRAVKTRQLTHLLLLLLFCHSVSGTHAACRRYTTNSLPFAKKEEGRGGEKEKKKNPLLFAAESDKGHLGRVLFVALVVSVS